MHTTLRAHIPTTVLFASLLFTALGPVAAHAQDAPQRVEAPQRLLLLQVGGDPNLAAPLGPGLREALFQEARTLQLVPLPTDGSCADLECGLAFLSTGAADIAVHLELFGAGGVCEGVQVTVVVAEGRRYTGATEVGADGVPAATRIALTQAAARMRGTALPSLSVEGTPEGASITLDGQPWGAVPHSAETEPGQHVVEVSALGHAPERREVTLLGEDVRLDIALTANPSSDSTALWVAGIGTLALGVAAILVGTVGFAMGESCTDATCTSIERPDVGGSAAWLASGGALTIGGVVMLGIAASSGAGTSEQRARLTLRTSF